MRIDQLRIQGLRCLTDVAISLEEGINFFVGDNGAGKTSVLEAAFLLSHGRSFRSGARDALLQRGASALNIYADVFSAESSRCKMGLGRENSRWKWRLDGKTVPLSQLVSACAVVSFDPGSHALISGPADERRRFLDWGVFHVEHGFLPLWGRYQRALKQRNSLLRSSPADDVGLFEPWEIELDQTAQLIDQYRREYADAVSGPLRSSCAKLLPELGDVSVIYRRGWTEDGPLRETLRQQRVRDAGRGYTGQGIHRADWSIVFKHAPMREHLSRGQEKLVALACLLAQASTYATKHQQWPVFCLDDLSSELDEAHEQALVAQLLEGGAQLLITGTRIPPGLREQPHRVFHVEQGRVTPCYNRPD